jgi:rubrerythrin
VGLIHIKAVRRSSAKYLGQTSQEDLMSTEQTLQALSEALDDEHRARATYRKVIERFGPVRPFTNIVEAETRHIAALLRQFQRFRASPPADTWQERVSVPASLAQACAEGVQAEVENEALYKRLLDQVADPGVRAVMQRLQAASRERHLPAFQRCVQRYAASPSGMA